MRVLRSIPTWLSQLSASLAAALVFVAGAYLIGLFIERDTLNDLCSFLDAAFPFIVLVLAVYALLTLVLRFCRWVSNYWAGRKPEVKMARQLHDFGEEIRRCRCLIHSIASGMTNLELLDYRESVQVALKVLACRLDGLGISTLGFPI